MDLILEACGEVRTPVPKRIRFEVDKKLLLSANKKVSATPSLNVSSPVHELSSLVKPLSDLNPKYRFDNFIVGPSNQLGHAASVAVGCAPGHRYKPFLCLWRCWPWQDSSYECDGTLYVRTQPFC